jgi:hypothetical protein
MKNANIAQINFINNPSYAYAYYKPQCISYNKPNTTKGYGAIIKLLSKGPQPSRKAILSHINRPTDPGYYADTFQRLLWSKLISYSRTSGYSLTELGKAYAIEHKLNA